MTLVLQGFPSNFHHKVALPKTVWILGTEVPMGGFDLPPLPALPLPAIYFYYSTVETSSM